MNKKELWNIYMRACRIYARKLNDRPADVPYRLLCSIEFWKEHRYWPHIKNPRSFSEKIFHRMLFNRDPQLTVLSDKWKARSFIGNLVGNQYLIPVLWQGDNPEDIPFDSLPDKYVIKTNHGAGFNIIVPNKFNVDAERVKRQLRLWLKANFCYSTLLGMSWAYKNIKPTVIIETFLENNGAVPEDYKFFCFAGKVEYIQVSLDRFGNASEQILNSEFDALPLWNRCRVFPGKLKIPDNFILMKALAETISKEFDFIRVDMYNVAGRIYIGELTFYPAAGLARFIPVKYDFIFGKKWKTI